MAYKKSPPIKINLSSNDYCTLITGLKINELTFTGFISDDAKSLTEKIEKHRRFSEDENGDLIVNLAFYENEAKRFIWQFLAASSNAADYLELLETADKYAVE